MESNLLNDHVMIFFRYTLQVQQIKNKKEKEEEEEEEESVNNI